MSESLPLWKRAAFNVYRGLTGPWRRRHLERLAAAGRAPVTVLVFHRIADDVANEWTTPSADFRAGIDWLQAHFDLISLAEVQARLGGEGGASRRPAVCITFDDGYESNCATALPLLIERRIPCTYFVAVANVVHGNYFQHDLARGDRFLPNTIQQLREMSRAGIEIGCHSRTHPNLGTLTDPAALYDEIVTARNDLEAALETRIRYFAFPYGFHANLSQAAFAVARQYGYQGVCSAYGGLNWPGDDAFHLQRRAVDGPVCRMKNRALHDPWRPGHTPRFAYGVAAAEAAPAG